MPADEIPENERQSRELSAADRERIYAEERARLEARQSLESGAAKSKPGGSCRRMLLVAGVLFVGFALIGAMGSTSDSPSRSNDLPNGPGGGGVGVEAKLSSDGKTDVVVAKDKKTLDELVKAANAEDSVGFALILMSGNAFSAPTGTKVRTIDRSVFTYQVRIAEGDQGSRLGGFPSIT